MRKRILKKSELLREGYVKGLRKAQKIIMETLQTADGRTIQDDARVWVDCFYNFCFENGETPCLVVNCEDCDEPSNTMFEILSVKYDKGGNRFVIEVKAKGNLRLNRFYINNARNVIHDFEIDDIPASCVDVEISHDIQPLADVLEGAESIMLFDCPKFIEALPRP